MALSFKEVRQHHATIKAVTKALKEKGLSFKEVRSLQSTKVEAIKALKAKVVDSSGLVADFVAGKFNNLLPLKFRAKLVEVSKLPHSFEDVRDATARYLELNIKNAT